MRYDPAVERACFRLQMRHAASHGCVDVHAWSIIEGMMTRGVEYENPLLVDDDDLLRLMDNVRAEGTGDLDQEERAAMSKLFWACQESR